MLTAIIILLVTFHSQNLVLYCLNLKQQTPKLLDMYDMLFKLVVFAFSRTLF